MFLRTHRICDPPFISEELSYIFRSFTNLGYPKHMLNKVLSDVRRKHYGEVTEREAVEKRPLVSLPFSDFTQRFVCPVFRANDVNVVHGSKNTLRSILVKTKPVSRVGNLDKPGVYVVPCSDCSLSYVGETGRCFSTRLKEHRGYVRTGNNRSAIYNHVRNTNHDINWASSKIVYPSSHKQNRLIVESTLIKHLPNFNNMPGVSSVDQLTQAIILQTNPHILNNLPPPQ